MLEKLKKLKENKILKFIGNLLYILMFLLVVLMLVVVIMQRATNNNIAIGGVRMFAVATGSMVPVYDVGDILISKEVEPQELEVGDDIVYMGQKGTFNGKVVTHRIISIEQQEDGKYKIITQGVANNTSDPEIDESQVYGKIIYDVRSLSLLSKMTRNIYVFYFIMFIPVAILVYINIKRFKNVDEEEIDEVENVDETENLDGIKEDNDETKK